MGSFFNMDNGFFTAIGKAVDIIIISIVWILLCIPVITMGPATTALYYTIVKSVRRERGYLMKEFFHSFKTNFKNGAFAGIILVILYFIMYFDRTFAIELGGTKGILLLSVFNAMIFLLLCVTIYVFPILSRFKLGTFQLFKTSLFMAMKHLPSTILLLIIAAVFALGIYIMPLVLLVAPALYCLVSSFIIERVFKKYMPEKSDEEENTRVDEWYLE